MECRFQVTTPTTVFKAEEFMKELHPRDKVSSSLVLEPSGRMELLRTQSRSLGKLGH
jgi:hypothetical protein